MDRSTVIRTRQTGLKITLYVVNHSQILIILHQMLKYPSNQHYKIMYNKTNCVLILFITLFLVLKASSTSFGYTQFQELKVYSIYLNLLNGFKIY